MIKPALSTAARPELTLDAAIALAAELGYLGLDLRSFGQARPAAADATTTRFTPDPALTGAAKARDLFEDAGIDPAGVSTSIRYDAPVWPPVLGRVFGDFEAPVRETKRAVELAAALEAPFVRVFAFELQPRERLGPGTRRVLERLRLAATTARHTGVRLILENGGSFATAASIAELIDATGSPLVAASYTPAVAAAAGEDPADGVRLLGRRLCHLRLRDRAGDAPAPLGEGDVPNEPAVQEAARLGLDAWAVVEWDRLWLPELDASDGLLRRAAERLYGWIASADTARNPSHDPSHDSGRTARAGSPGAVAAGA